MLICILLPYKKNKKNKKNLILLKSSEKYLYIITSQNILLHLIKCKKVL